jgi:hypothetical protein
VQAHSQMKSESALAVVSMHRTNAATERTSSHSQRLLSVLALHHTALVHREAGGMITPARKVYMRIIAWGRAILLHH